MPRLLVLGGNGFFGAAAVSRLRADGARPLVASRGAGADVRIDVEDRASLRATLQPSDVLLDCVGPFQDRSTALIEAALEIGCDVIDIADSLVYAEKVFSLADRIEGAGIRVLNACSSVSAVSAALVRQSGNPELPGPTRVTVFLAPATRYSGSPATAASLLRSVGRPIRAFRQGGFIAAAGWNETREFDMPSPVGRLRGRLFESADSLWLPKIWPSLKTVDLYIDSRVPGLNALLAAAARRPWLRQGLERFQRAGLAIARQIGSKSGCLAVEIEYRGSQGSSIHRAALLPADHGYLIAVAPAVMAACAIFEGRFEPRGLVLPHCHVAAEDLLAYLRFLGVRHVIGASDEQHAPAGGGCNA